MKTPITPIASGPPRTALAVLFLGMLTSVSPGWIAPGTGLTEVPHDQVTLTGGFWGPRMEIHHKTTIPHALDALERNGHITNFDKAAGKFDGDLRGHHAFDSDLHKAMEGAMYTLQHVDDPELRKRVEGILDRILAAQQDDGFMISYFIVKDTDKRWENMRTEHQMYNAGHFFELAVEHQRLTGDTRALDAGKRFADHIDRIFGPGKRYDVGGHEEIELALIKLYRATGEQRYLDLCRFLLDERGHAHGTERKPFTPGPLVVPEREEGMTDSEFNRAKRMARLYWRNGRMQDHKPLVAQTEAVGHAVRAGYIYSAMADIARFSEAPEYARAVETLWNDVLGRKMYVNGGIGTAQYGDEGFGDPYLLPNRTYCESCSSIAHVFWQYRMNLLKGEAKYADVMELVLYNAALSGMALAGDGFFYQNPLESRNGAERRSWIGLACCPTNLSRFTPQVSGYVYAHAKNRLYVNLFAAGEGTIKLDGDRVVTVVQDTNYPWDGKVTLTVLPEESSDFDLCVRVPGWALGKPVPSDIYRFDQPTAAAVTLTVNGDPVEVTPGEDGYVHLKRSWKPGDVVALDMPMPVRRVYAHEKIEANIGKVALMRGPVVYCLEGIDHKDVDLFKLALPQISKLSATHRPELLGGITVLEGEAVDAGEKPVKLTAVPYYAWANREKGPMTIWINEREDDEPILAPTPPMGWNSWNCFAKEINEEQIRAIADLMVSTGMRDAGYEFLVLDDAWMAAERDAEGRLQADPEKFPSGMKALGDYIHAKGLKYGIYQDRGVWTCQKLPGSLGHEDIDMRTFAEWGVDYIKMDSCFAENNGRTSWDDYAIFRAAIDQTGRPIVLSISDFGNAAWAWGASQSAQLWRTSGDIRGNMRSVYNCAETSGGAARSHPAFNGLWQFAGPGHWNDPDMLQVGNMKLPEDQQEAADRAHFSLWCILAAPLMAGNDLRSMSESTRRILTAPEVIAVHQDPRGHQGFKVRDDGDLEIYNKPLADGTTAVLLLNKGTEPADLTVEWKAIGLRASQPVRDLWERKDLGEFQDAFTARDLGPHGVRMLRVGRKGEPLPGPSPLAPERYRVTRAGETYLSDLCYIWLDKQAPGLDAASTGGPIVVGAKTYKKGLGCPPRSSVMYMTDRRADRFRAVVAVDEDGAIKDGEERSGRFRVLDGDWFSNQVLWDSGAMQPGDAPKEIDIAIDEVECLLLEFKGKGARGSWAGARVVADQ